MRQSTIGILAGMGPRSTSPFLELVLDQCQIQYGAKYDIDYPHIIVYSLPTPFYIDKETDEKALKSSIKEGIERLQACGVDFIGIPCNSAHKNFDFITMNAKVPVLNIVEETLNRIENGSKISVFATDMTIKSGLYQKGIEEKGYQYVFDDDWQTILDDIILRIKNKDNPESTKLIWEDLISKVAEQGVDKIIVACTDLNVVAASNMKNIDFIDSAEALACGLIKKYIELK